MSAPLPITRVCDECHGSGRAYRDYYDRGSPCPECDGLGEWEDDCDDSDPDAALAEAPQSDPFKDLAA